MAVCPRPGSRSPRLANVISAAPASAASRAAKATTTCQAGRVSRSSKRRIPRTTLTAGFATGRRRHRRRELAGREGQLLDHERDEAEAEQRPGPPVAGCVARC